MRKVFTYGNAEYCVIDGLTYVHKIIEPCHHFKVQPFAISPDGVKYFINGVLSENIRNIDIISFDESSEIAQVSLSLIFSAKSIFFLPPKIRRVVFLCWEIGNSTIVKYNKENMFVSVIGERNIMNHYPLELIYQEHQLFRLRIRETVRIIGKCSYFANVTLKSITIPASVEVIDKRAFHSCSNLRYVTFKGNSKLKVFCSESFSQSSLFSLLVVSSVEEISEKAFYRCKYLSSVSFQKGSQLKRIYESAFSETSLKSVDIPPSVVEIKEYVFQNCEELSLVSFLEPSKLKSIGSRAFAGTAIESIMLRSSVEKLGVLIFYDNVNFKSVQFSNQSKMKNIGCRAFFNTNIESISFPSSI